MSQLINTEDGFDDADDDEKEEFEKYNPYNPKLIRVDTKTFSIDMVNEMINDGEIDLSPDFQRGFVWTDITRKSRLIESLLLANGLKMRNIRLKIVWMGFIQGE